MSAAARPLPPVDEHITALIPYTPGKPIEEVKREFGLTDIIKLASNENALGPSPKGIAAMCEAAGRVHYYPEGSCHELRQAVAKRLGVPPESLVFGNGSDDIIHNIGLAYLMPGDEIVQADVTFSQYETAARLNRAVSVKAPLRKWTHDLSAMADLITKRTRVVFIANPNNPTGTAVTKADVTAFMARVPDHVLVVFDEAYYEYVESPDYPQTIPYVLEGRNVMVLRTFSKAYGLAGLRVGYGVTRPEIATNIDRVREPFNVSVVAQAAAQAALDDAEHLARSTAANAAGKRQFAVAFDRLGLRHAPSEANFVWVDLGRPCVPVFQALLRRGVIVRTGDIFGEPNCIRVTTGTVSENARFITELEGILAQ
jgi:histidinol-phosphate aminotransferase